MHGTTIGITSGRKAAQLAAALERRGAQVVVGPTVGGDVAEPDEIVAAATDALLAGQPTWLVANTGVGMRTWIEVAERTGRLEGLRSLARATPWVSRGAKATGGLRGLDVEPVWVPEGETDAEVVAWLRARLEPDQVVGVQLHGSDTEHPYGGLEEVGARLVTVLPYRSVLPEDTTPAQALVEAIVAREVDIVTFTSPGAVRGLLAIADGAERRALLLEALAGPVAIASIGHVTSSALHQVGLQPTLEPARHRTGSLVDALGDWASRHTG